MLNEKEYEKGMKNTSSLRMAVDLKCKECIYDPYSKGTWRAQVEACTSYNCPLHNKRPLPTANNE